MNTILQILFFSVGVFAVAQIVPGVKVKNFTTAIIVAVVYTILNFFLGGILSFFAFPLTFITLGLFKFVIYAIILHITDLLLEDFKIDNFMTTILAAFLISIISGILNWIF